MRHEKLLGHWERLFCHVMQAKSHGRRWKFRIEPLRRKLEAGFNPYLSDSDSDEDEEDGSGTLEALEVSGQATGRHKVIVQVGVSHTE